jgi:hypothetical protein
MAQYADMESTERDLFCGMMSNKETREQVIDAAIDGLEKQVNLLETWS